MAEGRLPISCFFRVAPHAATNLALLSKPVRLEARIVPAWDSGGSSKIIRDQP